MALTTKTFDQLLSHTRSSNATMVDSSGLLKWAPHNLVLNSATPATQSITVVSGAAYTVECTGVSIALSGAGSGTVTEGNPVTITASTTTLTLTVTGSTGTMWAYRSDLGGMVNNPDTGNSYVPTTSAARYLPRRGHHIWNGSAWVKAGLLHESEARTNLLHTTDALVTQSLTVTAVPHTLHFTGTGTVTLLGASTAGPLVGTGTGENNRVSLTFTPTAAILTLTVTGTVTNAQLEVGSTPSSYISNLAASGSVTRAAETLTVPAAKLPWPTPNVIGPELVTNGTFDTDTDWTKETGWSIAGGKGVFTSGGTQYAKIYQSFPTQIGKVYKLTYSLESISSSNVNISVLAGPTPSFGVLAAENFVSAPKDGSFVFVATNTSHGFSVQANSSTQDATIDNISVREIDPLAVSIQMQGRMTYADEDAGGPVNFVNWQADTDNWILTDLRDTSGTGQMRFFQRASGVIDQVFSGGSVYSPGINVPFNIASRHGSTFINGAVDGVALTADLTPTALPDLSATNLQLAYSGGPMIISLFRMWAADLGDTGIAEASA